MSIFALIVGAALIATGLIWWRCSGVSAERPASLLVTVGAAGMIAILLCGCDRGPSEEDMAQGCASHRSPTWADLIECKYPRHEER